MHKLQYRSWVPDTSERFVQSLAERFAAESADALERELLALVEQTHRIHEQDCINLNPATNIMNPKA